MNFLQTAILYALARLREPSTWVGIGAVLSMIGIHIPPEASGVVTKIVDALSIIVTQVYTLIPLVAFLVSIFLPDRSASLKKAVDGMQTQLGQENVAKD